MKYYQFQDLFNLHNYPELIEFFNSEPPHPIVPERKTYQFLDVRNFMDSDPCDLFGHARHNAKMMNRYQSASLYQIACFYGQQSHIHALGYDRRKSIYFIKQQNYAAIQAAAANGRLATLEYLFAHLLDFGQTQIW